MTVRMAIRKRPDHPFRAWLKEEHHTDELLSRIAGWRGRSTCSNGTDIRFPPRRVCGVRRATITPSAASW